MTLIVEILVGLLEILQVHQEPVFEALTSFCGLQQLVNATTHLQNSATCIDPVFTRQTHIEMESGSHSSPCTPWTQHIN